MIFKAPVSYQQLKDNLDSAEYQQAFSELRNSIAAERNQRSNDDLAINHNLNALQDVVTAEINLRSSETSILSSNLDDEISARQSVVFNLQNALSQEILDREAADSNLADSFNSKLDSEKSARSLQINDVQAAILAAMGNSAAAEQIENDKLKAQIETESANQKAGLASLSNRIDNEEGNRIADITRVNNSIADESTARRNAISNLQNVFNLAISSETNLRQSQFNQLLSSISDLDSTFSSDLNNEISARQNADSDLSTSISNLDKSFKNSLSSEISARQSADSELSTAISNLHSSLNSLINQEISARQNATSDCLTAISNSINIEIQARNDAIDSASNLTKSYIDSQIAGVESSLSEFVSPTATQNGRRGLVPQPAAGTDLKVLTQFGWRDPGDATLTISALPSQASNLTFNRASQSPTWSNFDSSKLQISGVTSASDAGTFTAFFQPIDLYMWADSLNQEKRSVTWTIDPLKLPKPAAAITEFTFNRSSHSLSVSNFDDLYESQSGVVSATNAGTYTATFALKNTNNTHWSDDSTSNVAISWTIKPLLLTKPAAAVTSFTFNRLAQGLTISNFNDVYESQSGVVSATDAGDYQVSFALKNTSNTHWSDDSTSDVVISWSIQPLLLDKPTAAVTEFTFNRAVQALSISDFDSIYESQSGDISATNADSYTAIFALKNTSNTHWSDNSIDDVVIDWLIKPLLLSKPTAAVTEFTFDKSVFDLDVSNFDSIFINQTGTISASSVNNYSAVYSLKNTSNTHWSDNSTSNVVINWAIKRLKLAKPAASVTEFDCDDSTKNLVVANLNDFISKKSGTTSASDAGDYSVVYELVDKSNTSWIDDSTSDVTINWKINLRVLTSAQSSGFAQVGTLTFTGNSQNLSVQNFDSRYHVLSGDTSKTDAGNYVAQISPAAGCVWNDGTRSSKNINWSISKKQVTIPTADSVNFDFDGTTKTLDIKDFDSSSTNRTGNVSASAVGNYSVSFSLKSTNNFVWSDGTSADKVINWSISKVELIKPSSANTVFTYSGDSKNLVVSNFNEDYVNQTGDISAVDAGTYRATFSLKDKTKSKWSDGTTNDVVIDWRIDRKKLTDTQTNLSAGNDYTFDNTEHSPRINNFNSTYHQMSGDTLKTSSGNYTVHISPTNNYSWSDGTTASKTFHWSILKRTITVPEHSDGYYETVYNFKASARPWGTRFDRGDTYIEVDGPLSEEDAGSYQTTFSLKFPNDTIWSNGNNRAIVIYWDVRPAEVPERYRLDESTLLDEQISTFSYEKTVKFQLNNSKDLYYEITENTGLPTIHVGAYHIKIKPAKNYCWSTFGQYYQGAITKKFEITPLYLAAPALDPAYFAYDGAWHKPTIVTPDGYEVESPRISSAKYFSDQLEERRLPYIDSKKNKGTYEVVFTLNSEYYDVGDIYWDDRTIAEGIDGRNLTLRWTIGASTVALPTLENAEFTFDGNSHSPTLNGVDTSFMQVTGTTSAVDAGTYTITVTITDPDNYAFENGDTATTKQYRWSINRKPLSTTQSNNFAQSNTPTYNGAFQTVQISNYNSSYHVLSGDYYKRDVGSYVAVIQPGANYCWSDGTTTQRRVSWSIQTLKLAIPAASNTNFTFDKQSHTLSVSNFNSAYIRQTGTNSATAAGNYTAVFELISPANSTWADDSTDNVVISWSISKISVAIPSTTDTDFTYDGRTKTPAISNNSSSYFNTSSSSVFSATNAGNYSITYTLKDKELYIWDDSTTNDKFVNWVISPAVLSSELSNPYQKSIPNYSGSTINLLNTTNLNGYDSAKQVWSGTTTATNAGTYTATVAPNENYVFNDGTRTAKNITWRINKASTPKPAINSANTLTYNGNAQSPSILNFDSTKMNIDGDFEKVEPGLYTLTLTPNDNYIWDDSSTNAVSLQWRIEKIPVTSLPYWNYTGTNSTATVSNQVYRYSSQVITSKLELTFDGNTVTPSDYAVYDSDTFKVSGGRFDATISPSAFTRYVAFSLKDSDHYRIVLPENATGLRSSDTNGSLKTVHLCLKHKLVEVSVIAPEFAPTFEFDGQTHSVVNLDSAYFTVKSGTNSITQTNAGSYTSTLTAKTGYAFKFVDENGVATGDTATSVTYTWAISDSVVRVPSTTSTLIEYDGKTHSFDEVYTNFNSSLMTATGDTSAKNKGFYFVTFSLKNPAASTWSSGGTADIVKRWEIGAKRTTKHAIFSNSATDDFDCVFDYDGSEKNINTYLHIIDGEPVVLGGTYAATNAGTYTATLSLKNSEKYIYRWLDDTTDDLVFNWKIERQALPDVEFFQQGDLIYRAGDYDRTPTIANFDAATMSLSGRTSAQKSGNYTLKISPKSNYCWSDGTTAAKNVTWTISKRRIALPVVSKTSYDYTGSNIDLDYSFEGFESTQNPAVLFMAYVSRTNISATDAGTYTATFRLCDPNDSVWDDDTNADKTFEWRIAAKVLRTPVLPVPFAHFALPTFNYSTHADAFDNSEISVSSFSKTVSLSDFVAPPAVFNDQRSYYAHAVVTFTLSNYPNSIWSGGREGATYSTGWDIYAYTLDDISDSFFVSNNVFRATYNGSARNWFDVVGGVFKDNEYYQTSNSNAKPTYFSITGDVSKTIPGDYSVTLTPLNWSHWSDYSKDSRTIHWKIAKAACNLSISSTSISLNKKNLSATVTLTSSSDGEFVVASENPGVATVTFDSSTKTISITAGYSGTAFIAVRQAESACFEESPVYNIQVDVDTGLEGLTWAQIQQFARDGTLLNYTKIGDVKPVAVKGTVGTLSLDDTFGAVLIGYNHNPTFEGANKAHFALMKKDSMNIAFVDSKYGESTEDSNAFICYSASNHVLSFANAFPADLKNVMVTVKKQYNVIVDGAAQSVTSNVKLWNLSVREVFGGEQDVEGVGAAQYEFYSRGNSRLCYKHNDTNVRVEWWFCNPKNAYGSGYYNRQGNYTVGDINVSRGIIPCFAVG